MTDLSPADRAWLRDAIRQILRPELERLECYRRAASLPETKTLTIGDACSILDVSQSTLRLMREDGRVRMGTIGGNTVTTWGRLQEDIDRMLA